MIYTNDTIVAPATPWGESALAIIRLSGPVAADLGKAVLGREEPLPHRVASVGRYWNRDGAWIDEIVATFYADGKSFTGEPLLELCAHGNPVIVQEIVEDLVSRGARVAEPGEFSRRAFLNGKLDLTQAEAVGDLIQARSSHALEMARRQLRGSIGTWVADCCDQLLGALAALEAYIDFPEEDLPPENSKGPLQAIREVASRLGEVRDAAHFRDLISDGIKTVILGAPNAGKSSLINRLMGEERALVSEEPGTTRDYIRERFLLGSHCIQLMDTAGIHAPSSALEERGIQKTLELVESADFHLLVVDSTLPSPPLSESVLHRLKASTSLVLENKIDLKGSHSQPNFLPQTDHLQLSLETGEGFGAFLTAWENKLNHSRFTPPADLVLVNARHATALEGIQQHLIRALEMARDGEGTEWIAGELRFALDGFGEILGKVDNEAMLDQLFKNFCIGK